MNDNNSQSQTPEGAKKPGGTLNLENISIKTLKDDLAQGSSEEKQDQSGWFNFMAKHKGSGEKISNAQIPTSPPTGRAGNEIPSLNDQQVPSPGLTSLSEEEENSKENSSLDKELDQFKAESEITKLDTDSPVEPTPGNPEAPTNLPISDKTLNPLSDAEDTSEIDLKTPVAKYSPVSPDKSVDEKPALGSFFPPKVTMPEDEDEKEEGNKIMPVSKKGISGSINVSEIAPAAAVSGGYEIKEEENKNPFATRLQSESEKKSLLQSVESALNYSAPPEFSEERSNVDDKDTGEGKVVDLREKTGAPGGILKNKKLLIIFGGAGGLVVVIIVTLALVLGRGSGSKTNSNSQANANANSQANVNQNLSPVPPLKPVTPTQPTVSPQKILANTINVNIGSIDAITQEIDEIRNGQGVQKQTQLIFLKPDGSSSTFQDLMSATGINIPQKVLSEPNATPALIFADFFKGQTVFGLVLPTTDTEDMAVSKMKNWESTMILDLDELWKGIDIDNRGAYFADSQLFKNARFALIDKGDKLSLDYSIEDGFIFITCGRDSMTVLKNNFIGSSTSNSGNGNDGGIKWEEDETTTGSETGTGTGTDTDTDNDTNDSNTVTSNSNNLDLQVEATDD